MLGLVVFVGVVVAAVVGDRDQVFNAAPRVVLSLAWVAASLGSLVAGPWWHLIDPLRPIAAGLAKLAGDPEGLATRPLPRGLPFLAVGSVLALAWASEVRTPTTFSFFVWLALYGLVQLGGAAVYGPAWLDRAEAFNAGSRLMGRLARRRRGLGWDVTDLAVAGALLGWGLTDLVTETDLWHSQGWAAGELLLAGTVLLGLATALCAGLLVPVVRRAGVDGTDGRAVAALAAGWVAAQHLVQVVGDGHAVLIWLSDPLHRGLDLLGTAVWVLPDPPLPLTLGIVVTVASFAAGHLVATFAGHRAAVARWGARKAGPAQLEWRALLLLSLCGGTALLLGGL